MMKNGRLQLLTIVAVLGVAGTLTGMVAADSTVNAMHQNLSAAKHQGPVERFGLGRNAFEVPKVAARKSYTSKRPVFAESDYETGRYINGARVLVPNESALKADRVRLAEYDQWHDEYFGMEEADYSEEPVFADDGYCEEVNTDFAVLEDSEPLPSQSKSEMPQIGGDCAERIVKVAVDAGETTGPAAETDAVENSAAGLALTNAGSIGT